MAVIQAEQLSKEFRVLKKEPGIRGALKALVAPRYESKLAVNDISFEIETGEMVGYIGVNGAGKSTTIKMLTGILAPSGGKVQVLGRDPFRQRTLNAGEIGVVFGQRTQLWWDLALIESLNFVARIYQVPSLRYQRLLDEFSVQLELKPLLNLPVRNLSLGQRMRAELAATLIHSPRIVFLDEPTIGLDLIVKERIREFIKHHNARFESTVILTTHDLGDIEELCRRVIIIDAGQVIYDGPLSTIKARFGKYRQITFETTAPIGEVQVPDGAEVVQQEPLKLTLRFDRTRISASKVAATLMRQIEVADFSLAEPDLAAIVKQIYRGALNMEAAG